MWTKKILKLISVDGTAVLYNFKSMSIAEWGMWRHDGKPDLETFIGFPLVQDYVALLLRDILESWIRGSRFILQKESVSPELVNWQRDFSESSADLEDLPIRILSGQVELDAGKGSVMWLLDLWKLGSEWRKGFFQL